MAECVRKIAHNAMRQTEVPHKSHFAQLKTVMRYSSNTLVAGSAVSFRIHGRARKELKKKVGFLKGYVRHFWHFEDCNRVYGLWLDDAGCQRRIDNAKAEIEYLETQLNETL